MAGLATTIHFPPAQASSTMIDRTIRSIDLLGVLANDNLPQPLRVRILASLREHPGCFRGAQFAAQAVAAYELAAHDLGYLPEFEAFKIWISSCHGYRILREAGGSL